MTTGSSSPRPPGSASASSCRTSFRSRGRSTGCVPSNCARASGRRIANENVLAAVPYPGAVETVRRWHEAGHFILITSHRALESNEATSRWLAQIDLPHDVLHCSYDKISHCVEQGIDLLIDDSPVNLADALAAGIAAATLRHPWNGDFCESEPVICAEDWTGLETALEPVLSAGGRRAGERGRERG